MNYYIDTEFIEGPQDKKFLGFKYGETKPTIDLISLAIVAEDGREYYAISKDFNLREAWDRWQWGYGYAVADKVSHPQKEYWIRENVLKPIWDEIQEMRGLTAYEFRCRQQYGKPDCVFSYSSMKKLLAIYGKTNKQIAEEVKEFCIQEVIVETDINVLAPCWPNAEMRRPSLSPPPKMRKDYPTFYGYYSAYDHVVFCWLFGRMIDLPKGFPMYTRDLKQMMDEKASQMFPQLSLSKALDTLKAHPNKDYPKQTNEHSAIHDARWNKELHRFLEALPS